MSNIIMLKNANFSANKIGDLKLTKLTVVKDDDGAIRYNAGVETYYADDADHNFYPSRDMSHSTEIIVPAGTRYLFGRWNVLTSNSSFNSFKNGANNLGVNVAGSVSPFSFYDENTSTWYTINAMNFTNNTRPLDIAYQQSLFAGSTTAALLDGGFYSSRIVDTYDVSKIKVNWINDKSLTTPAIGLVLPELWAATD